MLPIAALLLPFAAQVGPMGATPQAPLDMPRQRTTAAPPPPAAAPARSCLAAARTDPAAALAIADRALASARGSARVDPGECRGLALANLERWADAEAAFRAALDLVPAHEAARQAQLGTAAAMAADAQPGAEQRAIALFEAARTRAVAAGDTRLAGEIARDQASALDRAGQRAAALASLAEARAALPADGPTWLISARASRRDGRLGDAQAQIERAAALLPADPLVGLEAGIIAALGGRDAAARKSWQSVIAAAPGSDAARAAQGYLDQLGVSAAPSGR